EFVFGFNGRMDHTAACFKVCKELGIPFISFETGDFGNGLRFIANSDCLDLNIWLKANRRFSNKSLNISQAIAAYSYAKRRFSKNFKNEWREYSGYQQYEGEKQYKIVVLPSSRSEF